MAGSEFVEVLLGVLLVSDNCCIAFRAAEEVIYRQDTSRASLNYLADASWLARKVLTIWNLENLMVIYGEPPPRRKKVKFVGPLLDFEGSLYNDYDLIEPPVNFNMDDEIAKRSKDYMICMEGWFPFLGVTIQICSKQ